MKRQDFFLIKSFMNLVLNISCYKTKGISQLGKKFQDKAIKLAAWRENNAQQKNKPRKWIISDEKLLDYACGKSKLSTTFTRTF